MKITKRQLRRIIREAEGSTKKYDDDSALTGGQSKLPDGLQKGIIDKTVEDREEHEEEEREEKNESRRITKRQLRRIIKEEKIKLLSEQPDHEMYASDDELRELGEAIESLSHWSMETNRLMGRMAERYGELAANTTRTRGVEQDVEELVNRYDQALNDMIRFR